MANRESQEIAEIQARMGLMVKTVYLENREMKVSLVCKVKLVL